MPVVAATHRRAGTRPPTGRLPAKAGCHGVRCTAIAAAIARQHSLVLVKGARQMGKTSLLAWGLQQARCQLYATYLERHLL